MTNKTNEEITKEFISLWMTDGDTRKTNRVTSWLRTVLEAKDTACAEQVAAAVERERERILEIMEQESSKYHLAHHTRQADYSSGMGVGFRDAVRCLKDKALTTPNEAEEYSKSDHRHCPDHNSPCGIEGKHRCCLCLKSQ